MKDFNSTAPTKYIPYLDANNLYGWAMSKKLPTHDFKWMTNDELGEWKNIPCILKVDLEYPEKLHNLHNDLPLPNLYNRKKYIINHETLKKYLSLGLKITHIHKGISFEESMWMKLSVATGIIPGNM